MLERDSGCLKGSESEQVGLSLVIAFETKLVGWRVACGNNDGGSACNGNCRDVRLGEVR